MIASALDGDGAGGFRFGDLAHDEVVVVLGQIVLRLPTSCEKLASDLFKGCLDEKNNVQVAHGSTLAPLAETSKKVLKVCSLAARARLYFTLVLEALRTFVQRPLSTVFLIIQGCKLLLKLLNNHLKVVAVFNELVDIEFVRRDVVSRKGPQDFPLRFILLSRL